MQSIDKKIAHLEAELSRLRAERDAEALCLYTDVSDRSREYYAAYKNAASFGPGASLGKFIELRPGWRLVRDEPAPPIPENVRRLIGRIDWFRMCMSYNESYFGEPVGLLKGVFAELGTAVNPIYPNGTTALYPGAIPAIAEGEGS